MLRIDKEGRWFFQEEEITHWRTYLLFNRNLIRDENGKLKVRIGQEECPVEPEDAPFVVKSLDFNLGPDGELKSITLILNDESREELNPETLFIGRENVLYCLVRKQTFTARFSRNAYQLLFPFIHHAAEENRFFLVIDGQKYELRPREGENYPTQ
ncbi:MAG: hypothetical protein ACPL5I_09005 [Thermodesulfobacteriota bacterium]